MPFPFAQSSDIVVFFFSPSFFVIFTLGTPFLFSSFYNLCFFFFIIGNGRYFSENISYLIIANLFLASAKSESYSFSLSLSTTNTSSLELYF